MKLAPSERIDQLYADDIKIIQSSEVFSFSLDAVLLANFASIPKKSDKIIDLCAGNGAVALFLSKRTKANITAIEIQERLADMGRRSIELNDLTSQIEMVTLDLKNAPNLLGNDVADMVVCNPPYFKELPTSRKNENPYFSIARHEIQTNLEEVIACAAKLLKYQGKLALVHRPERLIEIIQLMTQYKIAPKRIRFVYPKKDKEANILLIEGIYQGRPENCKILPPLYVYDKNDQYLPEVRTILYGK